MTLRVGSAGHPGPKIWDPAKNAILDPFTERDVPLGVRDLTQKRANPKTVRLNGGLAVFYTDRLVECQRDFSQGERELEHAMMRARVRDAADPPRAIRDAMVGCINPQDDVAILVVRFNAVPA